MLSSSCYCDAGRSKRYPPRSLFTVQGDWSGEIGELNQHPSRAAFYPALKKVLTKPADGRIEITIGQHHFSLTVIRNTRYTHFSLRHKMNIQKQSWILLIHQLPPKPTNLRVRIWR